MSEIITLNYMIVVASFLQLLHFFRLVHCFFCSCLCELCAKLAVVNYIDEMSLLFL